MKSNWPPGVDASARRLRTHHYLRLPDWRSAASLLRSTYEPRFGFGLPIQADAEVNHAWAAPPGGVIPVTDATDQIDQVHSFSIHSFNRVPDHPGTFQFQNSWGEEWGDRGLGYLTPQAFDRYILQSYFAEGTWIEPPIQDLEGVRCLLWKTVPDGDEGRGVHGREIVDCATGRRLAWAFARSTARYLELDEFVVWPEERGHGYGSKLAEMVRELSTDTGKPIRAWVPYPDAEDQNEATLNAAMRLLGLHLHESPTRAASYVGLLDPPVDTDIRRFLPPRATSSHEKLTPPSSAVAGPPPETDDGRVVCVWYATDRKAIDPVEEATSYGSDRDTEVHYGTVQVTVPRSHRFGSLGSNWVRRWLWTGDDRLKVANRRQIESREFWSSLSGALSLSEGDSLAYIHGYNVGFDQAALRAAQLAADLKVAGETAFFSWPSRGTYLGYPVDAATITASEAAIAEFLTDFAARASPNRLHVIAHSMGNRGLARALQRITQHATGLFGQLILAAPDIDAGLFRSLAEAYRRASERTTLYASPADLAVWMSDWLYDSPRAGFTPPITVVEGIDTIVVPRFDLLHMGHNYYAEAAGVLGDIFSLMRSGSPPDRRQRLKYVGTDAKLAHWRMLS